MAKTLFDHLNQIQTQQKIEYYDQLDESDKKTFNIYMIHRFLSMESSYIAVVNEIQKYSFLSHRDIYLFYSNILPKKKVYNKYVKGVSESKYENDLIEILSKHFMISNEESKEYLDIYFSSPELKSSLRELVEKYGWDVKKIKKMGL